MKYLKFSLFSFTPFVLIGCSENPSDLEKLKEENKFLRSQLDSINNVINQERFEILVLSEKENYNEGDSAKFYVNLTYERPNLIGTAFAEMFSEIEDIKKSASVGQQLKYHILPEVEGNEESSNNTIEFNINSLKKGINFFGGYLELYQNGRIKRFPFMYKINVQ